MATLGRPAAEPRRGSPRRPRRSSRSPRAGGPPCGGHSRIPAIVADRKLASVPASMARKPSRARSRFRSGASAPMPPSWMPTELKLANPASANDAMVNDRGSSCVLHRPELGVGDELVQHHPGAQQAADGAAVVPRHAHRPRRSGGRPSRAPSAGSAGNHSSVAVDRAEAAVEQRHQRDERHQHRDHVEHQVAGLRWCPAPRRPAGSRLSWACRA